MPILSVIPWKDIYRSLFRLLAYKPGGVTRDRVLILSLSSVLSLAVYFACTDWIAPSRNILRRTCHSVLLGGQYTFQSGSPTGFYFGVGKELAEKSKDTDIVNRRNDEGSSEILRNILLDSHSFGLVQEDYLVRQNLPPGRIQLIAPLYGERLHILYRVSLWERISKDFTDSPKQPVLGSPADQATREFFLQARVRFRTRPLSGGPLPFQYQLLSLCGLTYGKEDVPCKLTSALERIVADEGKDDSIDVAFVVAGAPLDTIAASLKREDRSIGLMSVEPALVPKLNEVTGGAYRVSTFSKIYGSDFDRVSTVGTDAVLIASREVPEPAIGDVLRVVDRMRDDRSSEAERKGQAHHPLMDYAVTKRVAGEYQGSIRDNIEAWMIFFIILCILMVCFTAILGWIVSSWKGVLYTREITRIYRESLPNTSELDCVEGHITLPRIEGDAREWVEKIIAGISQLLKLAMAIRNDYESGGITVSHQRHIIDMVYSIKIILQNHLTGRIHEAIESGVSISAADLRRLHTSNYVSEDAFRELSRLLESRSSRVVDRGARA